ncbi:MAG: glycosyltransferase family 2 protein [Prevotellaceae bacterium]|jgi:glycosyltransferase involved in cell wall biosynthesis|nr:glycosyltransferase family 2 protein [Prevotellaceae bacterium]
MKYCVIIPVYNSEKHIANVLENVLQYADNLIVVNDGSTDGTLDVLCHCGLDPQSPENKGDSDFRQNDRLKQGVAGQARNDRYITVVSYEKNRGKGYALKQGFRRALELGFTHAVTMDADGQHLATDIATLVQAAEKQPNALIVGSRKFDNPNMPEGNKFANNFSNFWFRVQTGISLPDTQTGFRVYPLLKMGKMRSFTNRYEAELEMLVRCAWKNIKLVPQPINVYYPPQNERLSHFRKGKDFFRISVLNTVLCFVAVVYGYPSRLIRYAICDLRFATVAYLKSHISNPKKI